MPGLLLGKTGVKDIEFHPHGLDGARLAKLAVEFAALGRIASGGKLSSARLHLFALAIELAFKSLALRTGASPTECKSAGHRISKMVALVEKRGVTVSDRLKRRLNDDDWFSSMLGTRYPIGITEVFFHSDYPEMVSEILETPCKAPLQFEGDSALKEINQLARKLSK